jgi:hypothetical protein
MQQSLLLFLPFRQSRATRRPLKVYNLFLLFRIDRIPLRLDKNTRPCLFHNMIYARAFAPTCCSTWKIQKGS